jgi:hypothetical protein
MGENQEIQNTTRATATSQEVYERNARIIDEACVFGGGWPDGFECPNCGSKNVEFYGNPGDSSWNAYECHDCDAWYKL